MIVPAWLWMLFSIGAAASQTARNAMQRDLIATLGTSGATFVRFLFGLPFAVVFFGIITVFSGAPPALTPAAAFWTIIGAFAQIAATSLMLAAMRARSFVIAIAYTKAEPVLVALFGLIFLGDMVRPMLAGAIALATIGVTMMSWPSKAPEEISNIDSSAIKTESWTPAALGLSSAALFALSAVGYRAGILALGAPNFILGATTILVLALFIQSAVIIIGLSLFDRPKLWAILAAWRPSMLAGFMGALASQLWFLAFAIDTAARVRTLALIEMIFAQIVSRRIFHQHTSAREYAGMALMVTGVVLLLWA